MEKLSNQNGKDLPAIGSLRIMKSGRVILRLKQPDSDTHVDLDVSKGIQSNFYQELMSLDSTKGKAHFLTPVTNKFVMTPNLESLFS